MVEIKKTDKQTNKSAETVDQDGKANILYNKISSEIHLLKNDIDAFSRRILLRVPYDFENLIRDPRRVYYKKVVQMPEKPRRDTKKRIVDAWRYFYIIRNLPLSYILKGTDKLIYMKEFLIMERENQDIRVFKQIEKMRKKGTLVEDTWEDCSVPHDSEHSVSGNYRLAYRYIIDRFRKCLFKKRVLSLKEARDNEERDEILAACAEYYRVIQRSIVRRKKETPHRRDVSVHSSQTLVINKIPQEVRCLVMPIEIAGFRTNRDRSMVLGSHDKATAVFKNSYIEIGRPPRTTSMAGTPTQTLNMEDGGRKNEIFISSTCSADGLGHKEDSSG